MKRNILKKAAACLALSISAVFIPFAGSDALPFSLPAEAAEVTGYTFENGVLTINKYAIKAADVSSVVGEDKTALKKLVITGGSKTIESSCFKKYTALESVEIDAAVTRIGSYAFNGCTSLKSAVLPDTVIELGISCFEGCTSLESVNIPTASNLTSLSVCVFSKCKSLKSVYIPDNIITISRQAFLGCTALKSVSGADKVVTLSDGAFHSCSALEEITIPSGLTTLGAQAFYGCSSLKSAVVPQNIKNVPSMLFEGCTSLESISLPTAAQTIGTACFRDCTGLKSIKFPGSIKKIEASAFYGCTGLSEIELPSQLEYIGTSAFKGCSGLVGVSISENAYARLCESGTDSTTHQCIATGAFDSTLARVMIYKSQNGTGISDMAIFPMYTLIQDGIEVDDSNVYFYFTFTVSRPACYISITDYKDEDFMKRMLGDINIDNRVDEKDVSLLLKQLCGTFKYNSLFCTTAADINKDGKKNMIDAVLISQKNKN